MSGIAVIWNRDGRPVDGAQIVRMTELMKHRGPDGERHWRRGPVAIGHCALNTTPEALADQQPLIDEAVGLCITFDGRIDNREELKTLLDINGSDLISVSDPRLVLAAYRKWGEACPEHLLGDFAFAIWDERQRRLFCARDFLGVRPSSTRWWEIPSSARQRFGRSLRYLVLSGNRIWPSLPRDYCGNVSSLMTRSTWESRGCPCRTA